MFECARDGEKVSGRRSPGSSGTVDCEFLNDRICEQFGGQFGHAFCRAIRAFRGLLAGNLEFEPLALPDRYDLSKAEPMTGPGDGLALRVTDLRLEHDVDNYLGHSTQRTAEAHLTGAQERRVLSQRDRNTDDRPPASQRAA
jgi:hypothetical protein